MTGAAFRALRHFPPVEAYPHGTRARYVCGCRCSPCRASNVRRYHERQARAKAAALEISAPPAPAPQLWTAPDGTKRIRVYTRACPGVPGRPCPKRSHLRKDSRGGVCRACRERLVWDGLVPAAKARAHLRRLSSYGVGRHAVAAACDVAATVLHLISQGKRTRIRASTEYRILAVDRNAVADAAVVLAGPTWRRIRALLAEGFTRTDLARRLGSKSKTPALQLGRRQVLARTAAKVERLWRYFILEAA